MCRGHARTCILTRDTPRRRAAAHPRTRPNGMEHCDVLIVGGGPGGSSCAWRLRQLDCDVVVLDRRVFPRHKVCAGWITPQALESLSVDVEEYGAWRVLQPITGF